MTDINTQKTRLVYAMKMPFQKQENKSETESTSNTTTLAPAIVPRIDFSKDFT